MKTCVFTNKNRGFTLVELLAAVAAILILMGVGAVAVVYYRDYLRITELDNAAREIYLAAENRAVLLSGRQRLDELVVQGDNTVQVPLAVSEDGGGQVEACYISQGSGTLAELLPAGTIEPALREGYFYIVYEPASGCVTDVFYAQENLSALASDFQGFYDRWTAAGRRERMRAEPMLGYYGGGTAEGEDQGVPLTPRVTVLIRNEEELTVTVRCWLPDSIAGVFMEPDVALDYGGVRITLPEERRINSSSASESDGISYTRTWVLDSLGRDGNAQFKDLFGDPAMEFGENFTVTATLSAPAGEFQDVTASDEDNSLFAEGSAGQTAEIEFLRHLQNLDAGFSGVKGKTGAVQISHIFCRSNETYPGYEAFIPIQNSQLASYDGDEYEIRELYIEQTERQAGLFSTVAGADLKDIRLVNATVSAQDAAGRKVPAGALAGSAFDARFDGCWVYWEPEGSESNLRGLLGSDEENDAYRYQITGASAGGLVGELHGGAIENCLAATMVSGTETAGGLIGQVYSGGAVIQNSYADCYLTGKSTAGLIGRLEGTAQLTDCYAAGFIDMGAAQKTAGLCLGADGRTSAERVYAAVRNSGKKSAEHSFSLTENSADSLPGAYYLGAGGMSYSQMTDKSFAAVLGGSFAWKTARESRPYNLREHLNLVVYSFPGLKSLPHYGDWGAEFKEPSLVYYEQYGSGAYGFSGGNARYLIRELSNTETVLSDGYAVAFLQSDLGAQTEVTVVYAYFDGNGARQERKEQVKTEALIKARWKNEEGNMADYYLALMPEDMIYSKTAGEEFFRYLYFELEIGGDSSSGEYFYNPHFAETVVPYVPEPDQPPVSWTDESAKEYSEQLLRTQNAISVRTPRHLYGLSQFPEYYHNELHRCTFRQGLNLDYGTYRGNGTLFPESPFRQDPVGSAAVPFNGVYDGGCHTISGVIFQVPKDSGRMYAGLFGYSTGTLRNVVYQMDPEQELAIAMGDGSKSLYVGALAGGNAGTVENCAVSGVRLTGLAFGSTIYVGGLVGQNDGILRSSAAELAFLSADNSNYAYAYVGGLVGENAASRTISTSYAVGRISAEVDAHSYARICGFVGYNSGRVSDSYAAADLKSSGINVETYGFCGVRSGEQQGTFYLNEGNFTYREVSYAANYTPRKARPSKYEELAAAAPAVSGMSKVSGEDAFPYPTALRDAGGRAVHYGQWPIRMELGEMGVYYWETLEVGGKESVHVSLLAVDSEQYTVAKRTTLSTAHDDGGIVTEYGYGYYERDYEKDPAGQGEARPKVLFHAADVGYAGSGGIYEDAPNLPAVQTDPAVDQALKDLMPGFTFHSYRSYDPDTPGSTGLYPTGERNSTLYLKQGPVSVAFTVNLHFADALFFQPASGWKPGNEALPTDVPGSESNPYEVRCVAQLELINWNRVNRDTETVVTWWWEETKGPWGQVVKTAKTNCGDFPYLSTSDSTGKYFWKQSHDLNGEDKVYTPIAEYYDTTNTAAQQGYLYGWFGGTYDGDDYVIENVSIKGQTASCAGLFGVVYNGRLENIILYSSSGKSTVTSGFDQSSQSQWYAVGALAGVAASHSKDNAVQNCSVAGYTINAKTYTATAAQVWGGTGVGGLLGISNMPLSNCTAVTTVKLLNGTVGNDNMRVGGLVGACQQSITNCYAGGAIQVDKKEGEAAGQKITLESGKGIYIGGIVGGSYMKPLEVAGSKLLVGAKGNGAGNNAINDTNNQLTSCYSYVVLPDRDPEKKIQSLYALGGTGEINPKENKNDNKANHGICTITNCYYLEGALSGITGNALGEVKTDVKDAGVVSLTYQQLAGGAPVQGGQTLYDLLPTAFQPVTSVISGFSVAGKYSYPPRSRGELQGMDYPFPTILTRENGVYHVHYGEWPINGIERTSGGAPIALDLFAKPEAAEQLKLSQGIEAGGTWSVETADAAVAIGEAAQGRLTVTARGVGTTKLTIRYALPGGAEYSLPVTVNVTAYVELRPTAVRLFPNSSAVIPLAPYGRSPDGGDAEGVALDVGSLEITGAASDGLDCAPAGTDIPGIAVRTGTETPGGMLNINYMYTHEGNAYPGANAVTVSAAALPEVKLDEENGTRTIDFGAYGASNLRISLLDGPDALNGHLKVEGSVITITDVDGLADVISLEIDLTMDGQEHIVRMDIPVKPKDPEPGG